MNAILLILLLFINPHPANTTVTNTAQVSVTSSGIENRKWYLQELRFLQDNQPYYYNRNSRDNNNTNFDNDYILFASGGTGEYHQTDNQVYRLTWKYRSADPRDGIDYIIENFRFNSPLEVYWSDIEFLEEQISYTEVYTHKNGIHSLARGRRVQMETDAGVADAGKRQ